MSVIYNMSNNNQGQGQAREGRREDYGDRNEYRDRSAHTQRDTREQRGGGGGRQMPPPVHKLAKATTVGKIMGELVGEGSLEKIIIGTKSTRRG